MKKPPVFSRWTEGKRPCGRSARPHSGKALFWTVKCIIGFFATKVNGKVHDNLSALFPPLVPVYKKAGGSGCFPGETMVQWKKRL
jgi:hypothetical protein